jgi:tRNA pseudouridine13 synthase
VVNGEWEDAVNAYLGMAGVNEQPDVGDFRAHWRKNHDVEAALDMIPKHLGYERDILYSLKKKPDNWVAAFRRLPNNLQLMTIHSLQSLAFNHFLAERLRSDMSISIPVVGDVVGPIDSSSKIDTGKLAVVTQPIIERIKRNCQLGRLAVCGTLLGTEPAETGGEVAELENRVLKKLELDSITWVVDAIPRLTTRGTKRALAGSYSDFSFLSQPVVDLSQASKRWAEGPSENDRWHPEGACINFKFSLPPGTYATTLLREFTRAPLHQS